MRKQFGLRMVMAAAAFVFTCFGSAQAATLATAPALVSTNEWMQCTIVNTHPSRRVSSLTMTGYIDDAAVRAVRGSLQPLTSMHISNRNAFSTTLGWCYFNLNGSSRHVRAGACIGPADSTCETFIEAK